MTITDDQNVIRIEPTGFSVEGWPVAFTYGYGSAHNLLQCNVFSLFVGLDGHRYMAIAYARPHVLDRSKTSKVRGRSIAAARLAKFYQLYREGACIRHSVDENTHAEGMDAASRVKGIRIYRLADQTVTYSKAHDTGDVDLVQGPEFVKHQIPTIVVNEKGRRSAARFERVSPFVMAKMYRKLMGLKRGEL